MRSVASWLAFLLDASAAPGSPCLSLADSSWSSSAGLTLCELPAVGEEKEEREEKASSTTYSPRQVLLACDSPIISLLLCLLLCPLLQVLQGTEYPLCQSVMVAVGIFIIYY